jgi:hypothetical protein
MANTWVILLGHASPTLNVNVGDNLIIAACSPYRFCVTSNNSGNFSPALPSGKDFQAGEVWPANGGVSVATTAGTISWDHQNSGTECSSAKLVGGGHTIVVS